MIEQMLRIVTATKTAVAVVVLPMPRYLDPCCANHDQGKSPEKQEEDRERVLRMVWGMKREAVQMLGRAHAKNVLLISPMEVLGVRNSVAGVKKVMPDGVHLEEQALDKVTDNVVQRVEEFFVSKKRGPAVHQGADGKRARFASSGEGPFRGRYDGPRGGRGGGYGGYGRGMSHTFY